MPEPGWGSVGGETLFTIFVDKILVANRVVDLPTVSKISASSDFNETFARIKNVDDANDVNGPTE